MLPLVLSTILTFGQIRYEATAQKLGTVFRIVCYPQDSAQGDQLMRAVWSLVDDLDYIFSDYKEDSEVTRLSQSAGSGQWIQVSDQLWTVLKAAQDIAIQSQGAFDVSIGPLSKLWRRAFRRSMIPSEEQIKEALRLVDYRWMLLREDDHAVQLQRSGMRLDLGGIAKGYIIDQVFRYLSSQGIEEALIDGGGDLYIGTRPPDQSKWQVVWEGQLAGEIDRYEDLAIASSGDQYRYLEDGDRRYSHIIDPRTGYGIEGRHHVVVQAEDCMHADALASTLCILNPVERMEFIKFYPKSKILYLKKKVTIQEGAFEIKKGNFFVR